MASSPPPERSDHADLHFRAEVARLRTAERRRFFPLGLHVGAPDAQRFSLETPWGASHALDPGLRFDLAVGLVDALAREGVDRPAWGWLTRPGVPEVHDRDLEWYAAVVRAFGAHGSTLAGFRAVTRSGWLDVVSGESRTWRRLRV